MHCAAKIARTVCYAVGNQVLGLSLVSQVNVPNNLRAATLICKSGLFLQMLLSGALDVSGHIDGDLFVNTCIVFFSPEMYIESHGNAPNSMTIAFLTVTSQ